MKKLWMVFVALMTISVLMAGCGKQEAQPVDIAEGVDKCEVCHMHIANDHHATEIVLKDGKTLKFDDIGCMYRWLKENGKEQVDVQFVRDYYSQEWVKAENGAYAYDKSFKTPMGYGIYSFKDKSTAESFVKEQHAGVIMTSQELDSHSFESSMKMHKQGHDGGHKSSEQQSTHK
ncbi:nitrous oxide reductase accessory protein NosL [Brevibacillus sp. H7]|uniref:nitrous oxide reductase accessory protein NosL n=1 Tax=Brevibacillus sp. H7 TaxID=3349138 RepID=UPI0038153780